MLAEEKNLEFQRNSDYVGVGRLKNKCDECWEIFDKLNQSLQANQNTINSYKAHLKEISVHPKISVEYAQSPEFVRGSKLMESIEQGIY